MYRNPSFIRSKPCLTRVASSSKLPRDFFGQRETQPLPFSAGSYKRGLLPINVRKSSELSQSSSNTLRPIHTKGLSCSVDIGDLLQQGSGRNLSRTNQPKKEIRLCQIRNMKHYQKSEQKSYLRRHGGPSNFCNNCDEFFPERAKQADPMLYTFMIDGRSKENNSQSVSWPSSLEP